MPVILNKTKKTNKTSKTQTDDAAVSQGHLISHRIKVFTRL